MADSADEQAPVNDPDPPPTWLQPEPGDVVARYRRAAPWIIAVFGLMGAVVLLVVPVSAISEIEPTSRRTIVLASILAFFGVAVAIIASSVALAPRSGFAESLEPRRSRVLRHVSARRKVEDSLARDVGAQDPDSLPLALDTKQQMLRLEKERNAVRMGFVGVLAGAIAIGTAMGIMVWEFENPTTVFEIDRIHAETVRIETDTRRIVADTRRIETEIEALAAATRLDEGDLLVQADRLDLELQLLRDTIDNTKADTVRLAAEAEAAPLIEVIVGQIADVELSIEAILEQLVDLRIEVRDHTHTFAG